MSLRIILGLLGAVVVGVVGTGAYGQAWRRFVPSGKKGARVVPGVRPYRGPEPPASETPQRVMVEDGNGGRVVYGRRWLEARGQEPTVSIPVPKAAPAPVPPGLCMPDDAIDFIVRLPGRQPVVRDQVLGIYRQDESLVERRHRLCGLRFGTSLSVNLETEAVEGQYSDLVLSVQLADHRGAITETELNRVSQIGLKLADATHRQPQFSVSFEEALQRAADLDKFCAAFDVVASISVMAKSNDGFAGPTFHEAAVAQGLQFGERRIFHFKPADGPDRALFSLANLFKPGDFDPAGWSSFATKGVALFLDVPCVPKPAEAFDQMMATATALCERLDGYLLDQERKPLTMDRVVAIREQIRKIGDNMERYNIPAGSVRALRLFDL